MIAFSVRDWPHGLWLEWRDNELHLTRRGLWFYVIIRDRTIEKR